MRAAIHELLWDTPLFGGVTEAALEFIDDNCTVSRVATGDYFFHQGAPANSMFVLLEGRVSVVRRLDGQVCRLNLHDPGSCFGEMGLMDFDRRSASVKAVEDSAALEITSDMIQRLYETQPKQFTLIQMNMGREICRRLRRSDDMIFRARLFPTESDPGRFCITT